MKEKTFSLSVIFKAEIESAIDILEAVEQLLKAEGYSLMGGGIEPLEEEANEQAQTIRSSV